MPYDGIEYLLRQNRACPTTEMGTPYGGIGHLLRQSAQILQQIWALPTSECGMPYSRALESYTDIERQSNDSRQH